MNKGYDLNHLKGFPFLIDDVVAMFKGIHDTTNELMQIISDEEYSNQSPFIVYGMNITDHGNGTYSISNGLILFQGQLIPSVSQSNVPATSESDLKFNINKINEDFREWGDGVTRPTFYESEVEFEVGGGTHQINILQRAAGFYQFAPTGPWSSISGAINAPVVQKFSRRFRMRGRINYAGTSTSAGVVALTLPLNLSPTGDRVLPVTIERGSDLYPGHARINDSTGNITIYPSKGNTLETSDIVNLGAIHWDK